MENVTITVPRDKAEFLKHLAANLNAESLKILSEKSKRPGMDKKIKDYQSFI